MITAYTVTQILESESFYEWLQSMGPTETIGYTRDDSSCPIARFLDNKLHDIAEPSDMLGNVSVMCDFVTVYRSDKLGPTIKTDTPAWAEKFIEKVDELPDESPIYETLEDEDTGIFYQSDEPMENAPVSANQAIVILANVIEAIEEDKPESQEEMEREYSDYA